MATLGPIGNRAPHDRGMTLEELYEALGRDGTVISFSVDSNGDLHLRASCCRDGVTSESSRWLLETTIRFSEASVIDDYTSKVLTEVRRG